MIVAAFWALGPILASLHGATGQHRYCLEHGKLEETAALGGTSPPVVGDAPGRALVKGDRAADGGHEACSFASVLSSRDRIGGEPARRGTVAPLRPAPTSALAAPSFHSLLAVLVTAPKTSPPRA